eukprot:TRINITY_DN64324_c0_g1_i1.p1 TRINITY_DN64324_c0_g1~~TRINITY_DN64324_c0_g1_i1.p1  ORF type:complete len:1277 (-),score=166.01 TRINITY_DN64324_c0_g1_i1:68-3898(-)
MGIPKFYRWLVRRYPMTVQKVEKPEDVPPIDNLYLDMNGLIHMVIHSDSPSRHLLTSRYVNSGNIDEVWSEILRYVDTLVHLVAPRKLLFIALDSVTPVTKMTQQRFKRIKDRSEYEEICDTAKQYGEKAMFDINSISPGTEFMHNLNEKLLHFVKDKVASDPTYQRMKVILSDSNVPGEGEHKIMEYLRQYKVSSEYDPNIRHCIYGMDADLIMLALVSHEPNIVIIREILEQRPPNQHLTKSITRPILTKMAEFEILYIPILREYFEIEYGDLRDKLGFEFNLERIIDDFVFFSLFVGNDFVPYLCTVDINYGSLDEIIKYYKKILPTLKGYITYKGDIMWSEAEKIFAELANYELKILNEKYTDSLKLVKSESKSYVREELDIEGLKVKLKLEKKKIKIEQLRAAGELEEFVKELYNKKAKEVSEDKINEGEIEAEDLPDSEISEIDEEELAARVDEADTSSPVSAEKNKAFLEKICDAYKSDAWNAKRFYYQEKIGFDINQPEGREKMETMIRRYLEGLQWVLYYYYSGVKHWGWYYPYHYAPFVSDITSPLKYFKNGEELTFSHLKGSNSPITPFEQLLSILPRYSKELLPDCYHTLYDEGSEILDLYPSHYSIDYNGRELPWEAIKLIPFVDIPRIIEAERKAIAASSIPFSAQELARNSLHEAMEFCYSESEGMKMKEYVQDIKKPPGFAPEISPKAELPCPDFPSLKWLEVSGHKIVRVTRGRKTFDSIEVLLKPGAVVKKYEDLLQKPVFIGYPFKQEAIVVSVFTKKSFIILSKDGQKAAEIPMKGTMEHFDKARALMEEKGLAVPEIKYVCKCQILEGLTKNYQRGGAFEKVYSTRRILVPGPMIMFDRDPKNYLNIEQLLSSQKDQYPLNTNCIILAEPNFGATGKIIGNSASGTLTVQLNGNYVDFGNSDKSGTDSKETFISLRSVAARTGYSNYAISRLASNIRIHVKQPNVSRSLMRKYNLGLGLKSQNQGVHVPYHVKYDLRRREWMVSQTLAQIMEEYAKNFGEVLREVDKTCGIENDTIFAHNVYPHLPDPEEKLKEILSWIMALPISRLPFVPSGSTMTAPGSTTHAPASKHMVFPKTVKVKTKNVFVETRPFWIQPFGPTSYYQYKLGDRVINVRSGVTPFGSLGTIVGIYNEKIMVDFDIPTLVNSSYWGQCEKGHGRLLSACSVVNLSMKKRSAKKIEKEYKEEEKYVQKRNNYNTQQYYYQNSGYQQYYSYYYPTPQYAEPGSYYQPQPYYPKKGNGKGNGVVYRKKELPNQQ